MILIADSGSTKTRWELLNDRHRSSVYTTGINPFFQSGKEIGNVFRTELLPKINTSPLKVFFYGAGISQPDNVTAVSQALKTVFPDAFVEVEHDLLAAARATCGKEAGISCILGTGSNSCLYDGEKIKDNIPSLGFFLGDEGSGGYLGRRLLQAYFYRELPDDLKKKVEGQFTMNRQEILNTVHHKPMPNQFVASFAGFLTENNNHPFINDMLKKGFDEFVQRHVCKYDGHKNLPVHFIGSIAKLNEPILDNVMKKAGLKKGIILKSPMEGLIKFHNEINDE